MLRNIQLLIISFFIFSFTYAQQFQFQRYSVDDGLSQSVVKCIIQDSEGFMWFGTQNGLNRFDGYKFEVYINDMNDSTSISDNWIYSLSEDKDNFLWIGTRDGLQKYDRINQTFTKIIPTDTVYSVHNRVNIYGLVVNKNGEVLLNTPPVLSIYNPRNDNFQHFYNTDIEEDGSVNDEQLSVLTASDNSIWLATNSGISRFFPEKQKFETYKFTSSESDVPDNNRITSLYEDNKKRVWIGTQNGFCIYNLNDEEFITDNKKQPVFWLTDNYIRSLREDKKGNFWIGTNGGGLFQAVLKNGNPHFFNFRADSNTSNSISYDIILSLHEDYSNNLWIGTLQGINKVDLKRRKFAVIQKSNNANNINLADNVIASIYKVNDSILWIGNWGKGLNIYNRKNGRVTHFTQEDNKNHIPNDFVHSIFRDLSDNLWIGTRDGIVIFDKKTQKFTDIKSFFGTNEFAGFENNRVFEIVQSTDNIVWIATQNGLFKLDLKNKTKQVFVASASQNSISGNLIYSIAKDNNDNLWIGTTQGLNVLDTKTNSIKRYLEDQTDNNSLCDNFIVSLYHDGDFMWIGTKNGVNRYNTKTAVFEYFSESDGLPNNVIYEIQKDQNQNIWLATGGGLAVFNKKTKKIISYNIEDGLQGLEFNTASHLAYDGEIFFGGMNGVNHFYPDSLFKNIKIPPLVFTSFEKQNAYGKTKIILGNTKEIELQYDDIAFTIEFSALEFTNTKMNKYVYKMEGVSNEWIDIGSRNFVPFTQLLPGKYTFRLKGSNNDGVWNEEDIILKINVLPPWWRSNLAYISYILFVIVVIYSFIKIRERNLIVERNRLEKKVTERTQEIEYQKALIEKKNRDITSSISYASRIQNAMHTPALMFKKVLPKHFILLKPKDIVSGDFYWIKNIGTDDKPIFIIIAADCTGHGVPGAFMSLLGIAFLNEITGTGKKLNAAELLEKLREKVKTALQQTGKSGETKDGMDIALCILNMENLKLQFAGAYNPIYLISNNQFSEIKGTRSPIGIYIKEKSFVNNEIQLQKGDCFYIFSDGYFDQAGADSETDENHQSSGEKFKIRRFKKLILENHSKPMAEQKQILMETYENWKQQFEQTDDILVIGIRI